MVDSRFEVKALNFPFFVANYSLIKDIVISVKLEAKAPLLLFTFYLKNIECFLG